MLSLGHFIFYLQNKARYNNYDETDLCPQDLANEKKNFNAAKDAFETKLRILQKWLDGAKVNYAGEPMVTYDTDHLKQQLKENQVSDGLEPISSLLVRAESSVPLRTLVQKLQDQLTDNLQQLSDLGVECDQLAEAEPPQEAERLRMLLAALQQDMSQFKLDSTQKQDQLKDALKESEKKKRDLEDYRDSVDNLQKWIEDAKKVSDAPVAVDATVRLHQEEKNLQHVRPENLLLCCRCLLAMSAWSLMVL